MENLIIFLVTTSVYYIISVVLSKPENYVRRLLVIGVLCMPFNEGDDVFTILGNGTSEKSFYSFFSLYQKARYEAVSIVGFGYQKAQNSVKSSIGIAGYQVADTSIILVGGAVYQRAKDYSCVGLGIALYQKADISHVLLGGAVYQRAKDAIVTIGFSLYQEADSTASSTLSFYKSVGSVKKSFSIGGLKGAKN